MSRPRTQRKDSDPRHRFHAITEGVRAPETPHEVALDHLLNHTALPAGFPEEILEAVDGALHDYDTEGVRRLFDACILGRATLEELEEAFGVSRAEGEAYMHLFFDRGVFQNDFHVIAYIASVLDETARTFMKEGYTKGFRALRYKYASDREPPSIVTSVQRMFEADALQYLEKRDVALDDRTVKELRTLGKHVLAEAQVLAKIAAPAPDKASGDGDGAPKTTEFVIQSGPLNPTLDQLLSKGIVIAN